MGAMLEAIQPGKRQELLDKIYNVEAAETPVLTLLPVGAIPKQMLAQWMSEVIGDVPFVGTLDNTPATTPKKHDRYPLSVYGELFREEWGVSTLANLTDAAGVGRNEAGHQMMMAMIRHKLMLEGAICSQQETQAEGGGNPYQLRGIFQWLAVAAQAVLPVPAALLPASATKYTGAIASLTETALRAMVDAAYKARKAKVRLDAFVGSDLRAILDGFTNVYPTSASTSQPRTMYNVPGNNVYRQSVDELRFSTGSLFVQTHPRLACTAATGAATAYTDKSGFAIAREQWQKAWMLKPANTNLPADGSGKKGFIDGVLVTKCLNPLGQLVWESNS